MTNIVVSLIVPMFNERETINLFFSTVTPILAALSVSYEIICINDGSNDNTLELLLEARKKNDRIKIIHFTRNFGKEAALSAGLDKCIGQCAIPMDVDLQDPPDLIPIMLEKWREGYQNVLAVRKERDSDGTFKKMTSGLFYRFFNLFSERKIVENAGDFRLLDRAIIDYVCQLKEKNRFMKGLLSWPGGSQAVIFYAREERVAGKTKWNYFKLWQFAIDGITAFSNMPLKIWSYVGGMVALGAFLYAIEVILKYLISGEQVRGYPSLMVSILFLGGIQLISIGVLGEYLARIFQEVKQRPIYLIDKTYGIEE